MCNMSKRRPCVKPGTVKLLRRPVAPCDLVPAGVPGEVLINGTSYALRYNATLPETGEPEVYGYSLEKADGTGYDLPFTLDDCTCPDHIYRRDPADQCGMCKHARAMKALRAAEKLA